ncbi:MAG: type I-E CRISPR-associated protein Cas6/Cse3/CasE [Eubacteriales bacterium]|nr:type I-E CRISPR-associated protein Cas6/Cse3/CasE [Eubacteriales bacterium]
MYLSYLLIDTGGNPDRPRPGRKWISNIYNVHRRLSMAFPNHDAKQKDPHHIQPFSLSNIQPRSFLYRIDTRVSEDAHRSMIIVQSHLEPDWEYCFHNARDFLAASPATKIYNPKFKPEMCLGFRILVNPSVKSASHKSTDPKSGELSKQGKRISLTWDKDSNPEAAISEWFKTKTTKMGFTIDKMHLRRLNWVSGTKMITELYSEKQTDMNYHRIRLRSALLEGKLCVKDVNNFNECLEKGIGSGKSMGFGLLSVVCTS